MCSSTNNNKVLDKPNDDSEETNKTNQSDYYSLKSWIGWAKSSITPILPTHISESMFGDNGSFATIRLPCNDVKSITTFSSSYTENGPEPRVIVAAYDGWIYIYKLNKDEGGECELLKQVQLSI
jgi:autophagy-related protein 18